MMHPVSPQGSGKQGCQGMLPFNPNFQAASACPLDLESI
jgi:hypothetical protein